MHNLGYIRKFCSGFARRAVPGGLLVVLLMSLLPGVQFSLAQEPTKDPTKMSIEAAERAADELMAQMSVADKIGQLFVITFAGTDVGMESDIAHLITSYRIGGVMLLPGNLDSEENPLTIDEIVSLNQRLQQWAALDLLPGSTPPPVPAPVTPTVTLEITATLTPQPANLQTITPSVTSPPQPAIASQATITATLPYTEGAQVASSAYVTRENYVPLFVAISHEGDGYPHTYLSNSITSVPSSMAIGATWNSENAQTVGEIVGRELSALGFNLLLGPSLDVLDSPGPERPGDLGIRCFGGDPYWVGVMGTAYIRGVHTGSANRMATVVKHFPGLGGSDRPVNLEVATVRRSLEELQNVELVPFFAAAQPDGEDRSHVTDAMMTAHARYGAVRTTAKPLSFDAEVMHTLMNLPQLAPWREQGGIIVSDALGVPAVRKYSDPFLRTFNHRYIAREAFNAGNDLLLLSQFSLDDSWEAHYENIIDTIEFFREQYETDLSFQARVDESVRRILALKYRLYPDFAPTAVSPDIDWARAMPRSCAWLVSP
jgi:beta-N-acetylhexosaminidase